MGKMDKWVGYKFYSSSQTTEEFASFARDFKSHIKKILPKDAELIGWSRGHFEVSGFIKKDNKYVYFSASDVRFFLNEWYNSVLIRTAKHEKDYIGGRNQYISLTDFSENVEKLFDC